MYDNLPGNNRHCEILQLIMDFYADDERILAIILFGSLARGDWDQYSDIDLDIVIKDDVELNIAVELTRLCTAIHHKFGYDALLIPAEDEGDIVLSNLIEFSIRYHPLHSTKPAILRDMRILAGTT